MVGIFDVTKREVIAQQSTPERFAGQLNAMVRRLQADGGVDLLERQKRATRLRLWLDREIGMYRIAGATMRGGDRALACRCRSRPPVTERVRGCAPP